MNLRKTKYPGQGNALVAGLLLVAVKRLDEEPKARSLDQATIFLENSRAGRRR